MHKLFFIQSFILHLSEEKVLHLFSYALEHDIILVLLQLFLKLCKASL